MLSTIEGRVLASVLAGVLAWSPALALAAPAEPPTAGEPTRSSDEFAPIEIVPVEPAPVEPEPVEVLPIDTDEAPLHTDTDLDTDTDTDTDLDLDEAPIEDDYDVLRDSAEARDARRWTRAGIASTVAGAVLIAGGTIMGTTDPCDPKVGNNCFHEARDRAALTMGVPGAALLLGGIAMIVVGTVQKKRLRADLILSRERIGVGVSGRF